MMPMKANAGADSRRSTAEPAMSNARFKASCLEFAMEEDAGDAIALVGAGPSEEMAAAR